MHVCTTVGLFPALGNMAIDLHLTLTNAIVRVEVPGVAEKKRGRSDSHLGQRRGYWYRALKANIENLCLPEQPGKGSDSSPDWTSNVWAEAGYCQNPTGLAAVTVNHQPHGLNSAFVSCSSEGCKIKVKMLADFHSN